jgi:hypothetical protein
VTDEKRNPNMRILDVVAIISSLYMVETKDISIGQDRWIKWVELGPNDADLYNIDHLLEPLEQLWQNLETECVAACCGINAFALWPEDIENASKHLDTINLKDHLLQLKKDLTQVDKNIIVSKRLNNLFDKQVFIQLLDHISTYL